MSKPWWKIPLLNRSGVIRLAILSIILLIVIFGAWFLMIRMPGESYHGELPPLTQKEVTLQNALQQDVEKLAGEIGRRNYLYYDGLIAATDFLERELSQAGYKVKRQGYEIDNQTYYNLEVEIIGTEKPQEIVVVGGHYDSVYTSPAANDNGTGAAATLELARLFAGKQPARTLRFVEFVNEEPPFFQTDDMGSLVYAKQCRDRKENIVAMLSLETMGYYSNKIGSQQYPFPLDRIYPLQGNFIGFIGNLGSRKLVHNVVASFRRHAKFPSEGATLPHKIPGVGWSDQWAFWQQGYPGVMVTDTAPFRYPYYHTDEDTPDKVDYERLARVVAGLEQVITELAGNKVR
ncbi:peptidase, M28 family [Coleofasciculus chthonoplastes PCC 7420]|uniref:Peptidase, M28 family n=1 Tax=Coleofasciculus chthonoplastes PCC 7420 TaxID=118168 RepID=B4W4P8_9CYAN|nr:peptidase, M28 family [Coleofasciculus chthonoplastes PCC 7420]